MKQKNRIATSIITALVLAGCGAESTINVVDAPLPPLVGQFVDSPVSGLSYRITREASGVSEAIEGITDANGNFEYFRGDSITFSIGEIEFPATAGANYITPMQVFGTDTVFNQRVINTVRLLQTLDSDGDPENGITISPDAIVAATMTLSEGESADDFFARSDEAFVAELETWLPNAGTVNTVTVEKNAAIETFVDYIDSELNVDQPNAFDPLSFSGTVNRAFVSSDGIVTETYTFTPTSTAEDEGLSGEFTQLEGDVVVATGTYEFTFGNRHLNLLQSVEGVDTVIARFSGRSFNTETKVYGLCMSDGLASLAEDAKNCDKNESQANDSFVFSENSLETELVRLAELPAEETRELVEEFATDASTFETSGYKRVGDNPLFAKTGGTLIIEDNAMLLTGDRFSIGNNTPTLTSSGNDTVISTSEAGHRFNLSEGFTISFDVVSHGGGDAGAGSLSIYADNNTTSQGNSVHGDSSKFLSLSISNTNFVAGTNFSYTYDPVQAATALEAANADPAVDAGSIKVLNPYVKNSYLQIRTDSAGIITIDNLVIDTVAGFGVSNDTENAPEPEPEPEPEPAPEVIPNVFLPYTADFTQTDTDSLFTAEYLATSGRAGVTGTDIPMYERAGGNVTVTGLGVKLNGGRFSIGNTTPDADTTDADTAGTGVFDLSRPYNVVLDIIAIGGTETKKFQIYVDNNTSSSSKSIHGGDSRIFSEEIGTLTAGSTLTVPGILATKNSFIQVRTETDGIVEFNNLRIEYVDENLLFKETFDDVLVTADGANGSNFFTAEYRALASDATKPFYNVTGGGSNMGFANGQMTLLSSRFTLGETNPDVETAAGVPAEGELDLSKPYKVLIDIIAIAPDTVVGKDFQVFVDNNSSSGGKSMLGDDSKFYKIDADQLTVGTLEIEGLLATTNSFLQLRTETGANVTIDNVRIEYIKQNVVLDEKFDDVTVTADGSNFFTPEYKALASDATKPFYNVTGGGSNMGFANGQMTLLSSRFTLGETNPDVETAAGVSAEGELDLSKPYKVLIDIVAIDPDTVVGKDFQVFVDNNSSSGGKSMLGDDSKFFKIDADQLAVGTLEIEGLLATKNSFLQLRTETGANVTIDNVRIEYLEQDNSVCGQATDLYFCDDFTAGNLDNWQILASTSGSSAEGEFDILTLEDGNNVMRYTAGGAGGELLLATDAAMANVPESGNYYIEATIRPRQNSTTANKQLYLLGRYVSEGNWYGGGLNLQNSSSSTRVEVAISTEGSINRPVQNKTPLLLGEKDGTTDGVWYTVRFEMIDGELTAYLNGENMGVITDTSYTAKGLIGIFTNNRSFELDDIKVGDPTIKPIQLTLDYKEPTWDITTTTEPLVINIAAFQNDGVTADSFTVASTNNNILSVTVDGTMVTLTPLAEGEVTVTFVSGSDASIVRTIDVSIESGFIVPTAEYGSLAGLVSPDVSSNGGHIDTNLTLTFDGPVSLDNGGEVHIYKSSDDSLVDLLRVGYNVDVLSAPDKTRELKYSPLSIADDGMTLVIDPRNDVLEYGESYYVVVGDKVVAGGKLNGIDFVGLGENSDWTFTTKFNGPAGNNVLVDDDGDADFRTLQGALTYIMNNVDKDAPATISLKDGSYNEMLFLRNQNNITIQGESRENTIVQYDNYESLNGGSSGRPVFLVESADMLVLNNFTLKNTHIRDNAYSNQAEALYFNSSHRLIANNMNFISEQDTLLVKGYSWFYNSLVAGNVDFIWGYPAAALFEESEIRTIGDSKNGVSETPVSGGYVLQSRTPVLTDPGFVFLNSEFTNGPGPIGNTVADESTYIARGAGKTDSYDNVILINNKFDTHIITSGWYPDPAPFPAESDAVSGWREYGSMDMAGNLLDISGRVGGFELTDSEAASYSTREAVFSGYNSGAGWMPEPLGIPVIPASPEESLSTLMLSEDIDKGFAGNSFDITGGAGGITVTVNTGAALQAALESAKDSNQAITVYVDGVITDANNGGGGRSIDIKDMDNVSIIGVANRGEFDGIGISIRRANNIIIQNLKIHHVLTGGKDAISVEGDNDGSTTENIWIDHNELYSTLSVDKDYYDGLIDSKNGAKNITISYNYLHDHWKASLHGHTEPDTESSNTDRNITFHHNRFESIESRLPLFRYGFGHLYNNYYNDINSTGINSRRGAELLIENNVFENTQNPIVSFYTDVVGYWNLSGNVFGTGVTWTTPGTGEISAEDGESTSSFVVPYDYSLEAADVVKDNVIALSGVGKLDQSGLDIPEIQEDNSETPTETDVSLPFTENFNASDADTFFSADYKSLPEDITSPLYAVTGGGSGMSISNGEITMTSARFTIGDTMVGTDTSDADVEGRGVLDLSQPYNVTIEIISVSDPDADNNFQVYVDNNTSSSGKSMHGTGSKFYAEQITSLTPGTLVIEGLVATSQSFLQLRTESGGTVVIGSVKVENL